MGINTFPSNSVPAGGGAAPVAASGAGIFPTIKGAVDYVGQEPSGNNVSAPTKGTVMQGFLGDGDWIELPSSATGAIVYYDNTGTQITTGIWAGGITPSEMQGLSGWAGFMLDATDSLLYTMTNSGISTQGLDTVNAAGVRVTIGAGNAGAWNDRPTWASAASSGSAALYRDVDGSGDFTLRAVHTDDSLEEARFSATTGAALGSISKVTSNTVAHYKTAKGNYAGFFATSLLPGGNASYGVSIHLHGTRDIIGYVDLGTGAPSTDNGGGGTMVQWAGFVVMTQAAIAKCAGSRAYDVAAFDTWIDGLCESFGISV